MDSNHHLPLLHGYSTFIILSIPPSLGPPNFLKKLGKLVGFAEGVGFEPTEPLRLAGLANRYLKPLGHPSIKIGVIRIGNVIGL